MYQVLYRKWRPQQFADVSGQPHVTAALKNEVRENRLAHAYLFTGSRGTGKTTCAKILAKAVNCLHPVDGDPCNECDICRGIDSGAVTDVVEIDAAANNGVDSIRDLREEVNFTPALARYRVYIIDEVHELSGSAFNALLKTLEEPPPYVIFVLATTEVHKLPATILSRCQRFDFSRIPAEDIAARLRYVAEQEHFSLTEEAALLLARLADGALRDALSLTDQCLSRSQEITADVVAEATGLAGHDHLYALSAAIRRTDAGAALSLLDTLHNASKDMERLCVELIEFFRNLMILKSVDRPEEMVVTTDTEMVRLKEEAAAYALPAVLHCLTTLQASLDRLRSGVSRRVEMEMALLRLCTPTLDDRPESLLRRLEAVEQAVRSGNPVAAAPAAPMNTPAAKPAVPAAPAAPAPAKAAPAMTADDTDVPWAETPPPVKTAPPAVPFDAPAAPAVAAPPSAPLPAAPEGPAPIAAPPAAPGETPLACWPDVLAKLGTDCPPLAGVLVGSTAVTEGQRLTILTDNDLFRDLVKMDGNSHALLAAVRSVTGHNYRIGVRTASPAAAAPELDPLAAFLQQSRQNGVQIEIE